MYIDTDCSLYELCSHGTTGFSFQISEKNIDTSDNINIHWHEEIELLYVPKGCCHAVVDGKEHVIPCGDGLFVNSNVLHEYNAVSSEEKTETVCILFKPGFISHESSDIFHEYIEPFISDSSVPGIHLKSDTPRGNQIISLILDMISDITDKLNIHILTSMLWQKLIPILDTSAEGVTSPVRKRARMMLTFIQNHYAEDLSVLDIAGSANISRSECFRCFQKAVGRKPVQVLNDYRLEQAAAMLKTTDLPVSEVSLACGFGSQSYFGMLFARKYNTSPRRYRQHD